jgi:type I restriction-modification system DNA methylase subunit
VQRIEDGKKLRGDYKQSEYGKVTLRFTVLRRMDCVPEETKEAVLAENAARNSSGIKLPIVKRVEIFLRRRLSRQEVS